MSIVTRKYTMAAGAEVSFSRNADFLRCLYSTGTISVEFDDGADSGELEAGLAYFPEGGFSRVRLVNNTAASVTLTVAVGKGTMEDNRATVNTGQTLPTREGSPDTLTHNIWQSLAGAPVNMVHANALRKSLILKADVSNTDYIQVGLEGSVTGAASGIRLEAGSVLIVDSTAGWDLFSGSANQQVWATELLWSA